MNLQPIELANTKLARAEAWDEYMQVIDREHTPAEFDAALTKATEADTAVSAWYQRWQNVGGTSDIASIVEAEKNEQTYVPKFNPFLEDPLDLGTHNKITGGDIVEIDSPWSPESNTYFGSSEWFEDQPEIDPNG